MLLRIALLFALTTFAWTARLHAGYDPLMVAGNKPVPRDLVVNDQARSRAIPIRVYLPVEKTPAAVILFSHGLGGNCRGNAYLKNDRAAQKWLDGAGPRSILETRDTWQRK
jgi:predicted dienelactone hydrolase